jgi:hypothetical protein
MASNIFNFGSATVDYSVTNLNVSSADTLDNFQPFSFFEYLKYSKQVATPEQFTQGYNDYLQSWYSKTNAVPAQQINQIRQNYVDLLKDIAINYTTVDEKRFLNNLNYDDASDLAIAIPFYARKLKEICLFYTKKREAIKNKSQDVKIKGSTTSIEKVVFQNIIDYLYAAEDEGIINVDLQQIAQNIQIDVVDYFDTYSNYFDLDPSASVDDLQITNKLRRQYFTSNVNAISAQLFLGFSNAVLSDIFSTPFYLKEIGAGLIINPKLFIEKTLFDFNCEINPIAEILNADTDALSSNYALKRKLVQKYIGTDFYYLSTNSHSQFVSGTLFKAENACGNLLNKRFASTATVPEEQLKTAQQLGLFFRPDKMGVIQFAAPNKSYYINQNSLKPNFVYVFPDPNIYGNVTNFYFSNLEYPLQFAIDYSSNIKKLDAGLAYGYIKSNEYMQNFFAYFSEPLYINSLMHNSSAFASHLQCIFNEGIFTQYKQDVYGNEFGLLKDIRRYNQNQNNISNVNSKCITMDGHVFNDLSEGFNFNYAVVEDNYFGSIRTGLTAKTIDEAPPGGGTFTTGYTFASAGMFALTGSKYTLYFREYSPYFACDNINANYVCSVRDGGFFTAADNALLPDVPSDSAAWNASSRVYYTVMCDAGISATNVLKPGKNAAAFTATVVAPALSNSIYQVFDSNYFNNDCHTITDYDYSESLGNYIDEVNPGCTTIVSASDTIGAESIQQMKSKIGSILVKNIINNQVLPLSSALSATFFKYPVAVKNEIYSTNVENFNLIYNTIIIKTPHYVVFDKIDVDSNGNFIKTGTLNSTITIADNNYEQCSNSFFVEHTNDVWTFKTTLLYNALSASNAKCIYPTIYKYNVNSNAFERKYPANTDVATLSTMFANALSGINIVRIENANIAYAQTNNKYALTWTGYDLNNMSYIFAAWFDLVGDAVVFDSNLLSVFAPEELPFTYNFINALSSFTTIDVLSTANASFNARDGNLFFN